MNHCSILRGVAIYDIYIQYMGVSEHVVFTVLPSKNAIPIKKINEHDDTYNSMIVDGMCNLIFRQTGM